MFLNEIDKIRCNEDYESSKLYMLEKISSKCGLFYFDEKICFLYKTETCNSMGEVTSFLEFKPYMHILSVENDASFETGRYDVLILKEKENNELILSFVGFCRTFAADPVLSFYDFVHSIIVLFQPSQSQGYLNCIGLFGELFFLKTCYLKGVNLTTFWHQEGINSKYDFSLKDFNIEIKTSEKDNTIFKLKHNQLFNNEENYIGLVSIKESGNSGISLKELVDYFQKDKVFSCNLLFQIALAKEIKKEIDIELYEKKFICSDIYCFNSKDIDTINNIPFCISDLIYNYDFDLTESFNINEMITLIKSSI